MKQLSLDTIGEGDAACRVGQTAFAAILKARQGDPAFRLTEAVLIDVLRPALAKELPKVARIAGRNLLFDALAKGCGLEEPFTKSASGQVAKAMNEIAKAFPFVAAEEMTRVAVAVRKKYEGAGPMAVSAHFHEFVRRARPKAKDTAPAGWLAKLNELFPDSVMAKGQAFEITKETEYNWRGLHQSVRDAILSSPNVQSEPTAATTRKSP